MIQGGVSPLLPGDQVPLVLRPFNEADPYTHIAEHPTHSFTDEETLKAAQEFSPVETILGKPALTSKPSAEQPSPPLSNVRPNYSKPHRIDLSPSQLAIQHVTTSPRRPDGKFGAR